MRKLISLILVLITLLALCVPATAEEDQYETVSYVYSSSGGSDNFSFYSNCQDTFENAWRAGDTHGYFKLFANEKSGLQIKDIELRYVNGNFANAAISGGTKVDPDKYYQCGDWLRINDIHSKVFTVGIDSGLNCNTVDFDEIRVHYEDAEIIEEDHEIIYFDFSTKSYSEHFGFDSSALNSVYWLINENAKIYSTDKDYQIKRLEIFLHMRKSDKDNIIVSNGKFRENGKTVNAGDVIHIDDVHSPSVSFDVGYCEGTDVIVYYEPVGTGSTISEGSIWIVAAVGACVVIGAAVIIHKRKQTE